MRNLKMNIDVAGETLPQYRLPLGKMLTSALPFIALAMPGAAYAQATNTATVTAPTGAIEVDTADNEATDTDTLLATIVANDDSATGAFGTLGANNVLNVLNLDLFNGNPATAADVTISVAPTSTVPAQLTFDTATGDVDVVAGTAAGTYSFDYRICETANPTNCVEATATVIVQAPTITADADSIGGVNGLVGGADVLNVLDGDLLGGNPVSLTSVTLSVVTPATAINGGPVPTLNPATGLVSVPAATPAGVYEIVYQICDVNNPTICATETATITVVAATILADDDSVTGVDGLAGAADVLDVLPGDTLGGNPVTTGNVDISVVTAATAINGGPVPTLNVTTGLISVHAGTPAGDYTIEYRICEELNSGNCDIGLATVTVAPPVVVADDDSASGINGANGAADVVNVLDGDQVNGVPVNLGDAILTVITPATPIGGRPVPTLNVATGFVSVPAGTPAGTYTITYQICDALNPTVCDQADVTITVVAPAISADNDSVSGLNGVTGAADVLDVLAGDLLNTVAATTGNVTVSVVTAATPINGGPVPTLNTSTGLVQLPAGTPGGTYEITYRICDNLNPTTNCADATATVVVAPSIDLSITKTNGVTSVRSGDTVTYTLAISNAGPDAATGAVVRDTPGAGLTCPAGNMVAITGDGVPAGSFTMADLTGMGITLGTLAAGQTATITYSCSVN